MTQFSHSSLIGSPQNNPRLGNAGSKKKPFQFLGKRITDIESNKLNKLFSKIRHPNISQFRTSPLEVVGKRISKQDLKALEALLAGNLTSYIK